MLGTLVMSVVMFGNGMMAQMQIGEGKRTYLYAKRNAINVLSAPDLLLTFLLVFADIGNVHHFN